MQNKSCCDSQYAEYLDPEPEGNKRNLVTIYVIIYNCDFPSVTLFLPCQRGLTNIHLLVWLYIYMYIINKEFKRSLLLMQQKESAWQELSCYTNSWPHGVTVLEP